MDGPEDPGVELTFADGKFVLDREVAALVKQATNGEVDRHTYGAAMKLASAANEKRVIRERYDEIIKGHFETWGS